METFANLWQYRAEFVLEWEIFHTKRVEKTKTHVMLIKFFLKVIPFMT